MPSFMAAFLNAGVAVQYKIKGPLQVTGGNSFISSDIVLRPPISLTLTPKLTLTLMLTLTPYL